jgi:glycolate oxidase
MLPQKARQLLLEFLDEKDYRSSIEDRITYSYDASRESCMPDAVVFPKKVAHVSRILEICNTYRIPIVPRGAGTGLTGGAVPLSNGIVMALKRFDRIIEIDKENFCAVVEPGVITADLQTAVENIGLFYPPDPASMDASTIGGNIAENAGGMRAVKYGVTKDYVMGLEVVLPNGETIHTGSKCVKDVVGYDISRLFVGSEGTLGVITKAILKLVPKPEAKQTLMAFFPDIAIAAKAVPDILLKGIAPTTIEFFDRYCIDATREMMGFPIPTETRAMLLMDVDGRASEIPATIKRLHDVCISHGALAVEIAVDAAAQDQLWRSRRSLHGALNTIRPCWEEEDIAVPIARIPDMIRAFNAIGEDHNVLIVSFGHAGDGNIHVSLAAKHGNTPSKNVTAARHAVLKEAVALEGRIAAEHGIGMVKRNKIGWNIDHGTLSFMKNLKDLLDPHHILNPGKVL